jgi:nicotinate-nucleotide adenylyltransferase
MKLGILGGGFNPIHYGHLRAAEEVRERLKLDKIMLIPTYSPPHKQVKDSFEQRKAMVELAIRSNSVFSVSAIERERKGKSFTIETIRLLKWRYPHDQLYFIMGTDQFLDIGNWHAPEVLFRLCRIVVINRPGYHIRRKVNRFGKKAQFVAITPLAISSTDIRKRLMRGQSVRYLLPEPVVRYIRKNKLYRKEVQ